MNPNSASQSIPMETCPVCRARCKGKPACHRCGTDLAPLAEILDQAARHAEAAKAAWRRADPEEAFFHAKRWVSLRATSEGCRILALSALRTGRPDIALSAWRMAENGE